MMFSARHFLRQVSPTVLKEYFEGRGASVPAHWWGQSATKLASQLAEYATSLNDEAAASILAELVRAAPMATERGRNALLNAASHRNDIVARFGELGNDSERALWLLIKDQQLFRAGEELHFFDYYSEGNRSRHYRTKPNLVLHRAADDIAAFKRDLCEFYHRRDGSGVSCHVEFADRHQDHTVQITIYVQALPHNATVFVQGDFQRQVSNPALEAGVVYDPSEGHTTSVAKGGKEIHAAIREAFALRLLKVDPKFEMVAARRFQLECLKRPQPLPTDPALGIKAVRVRKLKLAPISFTGGLLTIEAPAGEPSTGVYDLGNRWFAEKAALYEKFKVVHATIALQFHPLPGASRPRTINVELTLPHSSNLKSLGEAERKIAEAQIKKWQLVEPPS